VKGTTINRTSPVYESLGLTIIATICQIGSADATGSKKRRFAQSDTWITPTLVTTPNILALFDNPDAELSRPGLSQYEALRSSTTRPFEYLGEIDEAGTVEVGKRDNLVLLEEDPLVDITHSRSIAGLVIQGRWHPGDQIRERMSRVAGASEE
jgi:hypothetical protein